MRVVIAVAAALVLTGCAADPEVQANEELEVAARARVLDQLRDPSSAEFSEVAVYVGADGQKRVCGYVNANNAFGGKTGRKRFIAGATEAFLAEGENEMAVLEAATQACVTPAP